MTVVNVLVLLVALLHIWFLILEMFLWTKPKGLRTFEHKLDYAQSTKVLAANQGLYNGFLAAGLIWSLFLDPPFSNHIRIFFLVCVLVAGIYGGFTAYRKIFLIQAVPALITIVFATVF